MQLQSFSNLQKVKKIFDLKFEFEWEKVNDILNKTLKQRCDALLKARNYPRRNILYTHIPKAAGNTMMQAIATVNAEKLCCNYSWAGKNHKSYAETKYFEKICRFKNLKHELAEKQKYEKQKKPRLIKNKSECKEENIFRAVIFREPRSRIISQFYYIMANLDAKKSHLVNNVFYNAANKKISCSDWLLKTLSAQQYYSINYLFNNYNQSEDGHSG